MFAFALAGYGEMNVWSEKTTVCRIFSCQKALTKRISRRAKRFGGTTFAGAKAGEYRARTGDLLVANQALSQLS